MNLRWVEEYQLSSLAKPHNPARQATIGVTSPNTFLQKKTKLPVLLSFEIGRKGHQCSAVENKVKVGRTVTSRNALTWSGWVLLSCVSWSRFAWFVWTFIELHWYCVTVQRPACFLLLWRRAEWKCVGLRLMAHSIVKSQRAPVGVKPYLELDFQQKKSYYFQFACICWGHGTQRQAFIFIFDGPLLHLLSPFPPPCPSCPQRPNSPTDPLKN